MVERGVPLGGIQTFVGHISARMVRHYTHITSGVARKAVELLDQEPILQKIVSNLDYQQSKKTAQLPASLLVH
jgi:hypothetical protein